MKNFLQFGHLLVLSLIILLGFIAFKNTGMFDKWFDKSTTAEIIKSDIDKDQDGIDDYTDILEGAKKFIDTKPRYKSKYYSKGYPTDEYRVCTDLIWYALDNAGYDFKSLIDEDIKTNKDAYDKDVGDANIDFRRVRNIKVFLDRNVLVLPNNDEFNPGDIVVYKNPYHIAIISDIKNKNKENYIIHHDGVHAYLDNGLFRKEIIGHYRWRLNNGIK